MFCRIRSALSALLTILAVVITLITMGASVTVAQEEGPITAPALAAGRPLVVPDAPVPGGPGFYAQSALAFQPWPNQTTPFSYSTGVKLVNPDTIGHYYLAVVALPQGATITKFVVWYVDNSAGLDMWVVLAVVPLEATSGPAMANVNSSGASTATRYGEDTTITNPTIDNQSNSYFVQLYLPPDVNLGMISFRIDYAYPSYLPLVTK